MVLVCIKPPSSILIHVLPSFCADICIEHPQAMIDEFDRDQVCAILLYYYHPPYAEH
jgi:hypothetical protein